MGLLKAVLGYVDTARHTYGDLSSEIFLNSGSVKLFCDRASRILKTAALQDCLRPASGVLYEKLDFGFEILKEILTESILEDEKRLREILNEARVPSSQMRLMSSGHTAAVSRATSYSSDVSYYNEHHSRHRLFPVCGAVGTGV